MPRTLSLVFLLCLFGFISHAEEVNPTTTRAELSNFEVQEGSNHRMREGKKLGMELQLAGLEQSSTDAMQVGVRVLSYFDRDNQFGFQIQSTDHSELAPSNSSNSLTELKGALIGRHFVRDTIFFQGGVEQKQASASASGGSNSLSAEVTSVILSVGQQWQWKQFNFTMEWLGVAQPIAHTLNSSASSSSADLQQSITQRASLDLFNFSVGANF